MGRLGQLGGQLVERGKEDWGFLDARGVQGIGDGRDVRLAGVAEFWVLGIAFKWLMHQVSDG